MNGKKIFLQLHAVCTYLYKAIKFYTVCNNTQSHFWTKKKVAMKNQMCITRTKPKKCCPVFFIFLFWFYMSACKIWGCVCVYCTKGSWEIFPTTCIFFHCIWTCARLKRMCLYKWLVLEQKGMQNFIAERVLEKNGESCGFFYFCVRVHGFVCLFFVFIITICCDSWTLSVFVHKGFG